MKKAPTAAIVAVADVSDGTDDSGGPHKVSMWTGMPLADFGVALSR